MKGEERAWQAEGSEFAEGIQCGHSVCVSAAQGARRKGANSGPREVSRASPECACVSAPGFL